MKRLASAVATSSTESTTRAVRFVRINARRMNWNAVSATPTPIAKRQVAGSVHDRSPSARRQAAPLLTSVKKRLARSASASTPMALGDDAAQRHGAADENTADMGERHPEATADCSAAMLNGDLSCRALARVAPPPSG